VREKVKENGGEVIGVEGEDIGEWVLVDLGDMVVHIMQPVIRGYYRLEELWGDKEVKFGAAKRVSKRTAEVAEEPAARVRSNINQAIQTTAEDEVKKPARKPRAAKADTVGSEAAKPKRASRAAPASATSTAVKKPAAPRKKAIGTTVKVAASKTAVASAKQAAVKRATKRKPAA
jgi:ribosome-associated protein